MKRLDMDSPEEIREALQMTFDCLVLVRKDSSGPDDFAPIINEIRSRIMSGTYLHKFTPLAVRTIFDEMVQEHINKKEF